MTCFIASADLLFAEQLRSLCLMAGVTVTSDRADLLLLDVDMPTEYPACQETIRFSKNEDQSIHFHRPFSYAAFLEELSLCAERIGSSEQTLAYTFPEETVFTATEKRLLDALVQANGKTVSSVELALCVFGNAENQNELKVYIRHLRQKIEEPQGVRVIETVRGQGYRLRKDRIKKVCLDLDKEFD